MCGHGLTGGESIYLSGTKIGTVSLLQYSNNGYGDYAIVTTTTGQTLTNTVRYSGSATRTITTSVSSPVVGTVVYKYGAAKYYGYGTISATGVTIYHSTTGKNICGLTRVKMTSGSVDHGDSGGPWYVKTNGVWGFCGVTSSFATENSTTYASFTPYYYFSGKFFAKTS